MRVLIFTSSGGTAHDAAAYALKAWLQRWDPKGEVWVEHVLENASVFTRAGVALYNWIQRHGPWMHQIYWRVVEWIRPGGGDGPCLGKVLASLMLKPASADAGF